MQMIYKKIIGVRPWEDKKQEKEEENLSRNSGKIVAEEGEER